MPQANQLVAEVRLQLDNMRAQFAQVLPKHIPADRFARVVLTAIMQTPELLECERRSLWQAAMRAAQDGLMPDGRLGAIVIFKDRQARTKKAQWLPMIAGLRQKVRNSGEVATWEAHCIHERDVWDYQEGDEPRIVHKPVRGDRGPIIAAYSIARLRSGEISREFMWIEDLDKARKISKAERGPWQDWPEEMYRKTVAKRHAKVLPMSTDLDDLLRRPDEPDDDAPPTAAAPPQINSMTDALDALTHTAATAKAAPPDGDDELGDDKVIDQGEYAPGDDEQLPLDHKGAA